MTRVWPDQTLLSGGCRVLLASARNMHDDRNCHMDVSLRHRVSSFLSLTVHYFAILFVVSLLFVSPFFTSRAPSVSVIGSSYSFLLRTSDMP